VAIGYWLAAGVDEETLAARLADISFVITDLPGSHLGGANGEGRIAIDSNAAGYGWFIDTTALEHGEFQNQTTASEYRALAGSPAAGRADLLTTLIHEIGHELALLDLPDDSDGNVMTGTIELGTRRLPTRHDAALVDLLFQQGYAGRRRR
jgi:large repetitive protein